VPDLITKYESYRVTARRPAHKWTVSRDASDKIINRPRRLIESAIPSERLANAAVRINYSRCFAMRNADDCLSVSFDQRADAPVIEFANIIGRTRARRIATVIAAVSSGKQERSVAVSVARTSDVTQ